MASKVYDALKAKTSPESKIFVGKSVDIAERVYSILEQQGKTQKDLAKRLGKAESEVSKWLSGTHNLTMKSIAKLEAVLGEEIIGVFPPMQGKSQKQYAQDNASPAASRLIAAEPQPLYGIDNAARPTPKDTP